MEVAEAEDAGFEDAFLFVAVTDLVEATAASFAGGIYRDQRKSSRYDEQ